MLGLRPYQRRALDAIETAEKEGVRRPLLVYPTGTGKTVIFSHALKERAERGRGMVIVHREELADQAQKKLAIIAPEIRTGIVKADRNDVDADVVIASVQTASRDNRLAELVESARRSAFSTVIYDEAHHAPSPTGTKLLRGLGAWSEFGPLTLGFTATPERDNGKTLGVWEKVVSYMSIREAIYGDRKKGEEGGYLVPILPAVVVETGMDMKRVRKTGGDYSDGDLGREIEESGAIAQMADAVLENASDRKGVAFLPTVRTSELLADALRARGIKAEHVDGMTPADERRAILHRLHTGETTWVTNCAVLTEGFDEPSVSCVLIGRPTRFHGLYVQMVGRGTRLFPGKKDLMVIDIVGASNRHELIGLVDLGLDLDDPRDKKEPGEKQACPSCGVPCEFEEHRCRLCNRYLPADICLSGGTRHENCKSGAAGKVDVFGSSRLAWLPLPGGAYCLTDGKEVVVMAPVGEETWKLAAYEGNRLTVIQDELPADWAMGIGEDRAKAFQKLAERTARWRNARASDAQKSRLLRQGFPEGQLHRVRTMGEASDLSTRITGRHALRRMGIKV
jgi:superfamily II DNA or RNA helicase